MKKNKVFQLANFPKLNRLELKSLWGGLVPSEGVIICDDGSRHTKTCTGNVEVETPQARFKCHDESEWTYPCPIA